MKLIVFDRKKHTEALRKLAVRKAPDYVIEAYKEGYANVVNEYYSIKLRKQINKNINISETEASTVIKESKLSFVNEAKAIKDLDFIKAFFKMANLDMASGNRLPPNASKLIRQKIAKDFGLKDLYKKLR